MIKKFIICFYFFFLNNLLANEIFNIRTLERDDYIRIFFEMKQKPTYFVEEEGNNTIVVKIINSNILNNKLYDNVNTNEIEKITLQKNNNDSIFIIKLTDNSSLKRYLYTEPDNVNNFYRLIVDINKTKNGNLDDILDNLNIKEKKNLNDFLYEKNMFEFNSVDELIAYNDIEEKEIKEFEKQNNDDFELDDFLNKMYKNDKKIKETDKKKNDVIKEKKETVTKIKQFIVVLDAGHGGKDPGAIGRRGLKEKDVNLVFAKEIKKELEKNNKIKVILTRNDDSFISLFDRVILSMKNKADLFISVHSDSAANRQAKGASIYGLNTEAFNTRTVEIIKQVNGLFNFMRKKNTLISEAKENNLNQSVKFANILISNFKTNNIKMLQNPYKTANFAVLLSPDYPSILLELGFLSNLEDEKMLSSLDYRKKIAKSIANSVNRFVN